MLIEPFVSMVSFVPFDVAQGTPERRRGVLTGAVNQIYFRGSEL